MNINIGVFVYTVPSVYAYDKFKYSFCFIYNPLRSPGTGRPNARKRLWKGGRREDVRCITKYTQVLVAWW